MYPRWHILFGAFFSLIFWIFFPETEWYNVSLIFLASVFIDIDHYLVAVWRTKRAGLVSALRFYDEEIKRMNREISRGLYQKGHFHLFHTWEFHLGVLIMGFFFVPFLYIFIGMIFHSILDIYDLSKKRVLFVRWFSLIGWLINRKRVF